MVTEDKGKTKRGESKSATASTGSRRSRNRSTGAAVAAPAANVIVGWEDDPMSGAAVIGRPRPDLRAAPLPIHINTTGSAPAARIYTAGTREFRYWAAADALRRAADYWGGIVPANLRWQVGAILEVWLDRDVDLNAYYSRGDRSGNFAGLSFFHDTLDGQTVYSGESPDVVCHELGHAVLDALRPQLFNVMSDEVAAFHESFGDISAILTSLQLPSLRQAVLAETGGRLYRTSRLSRLAEQLGWAIRKIRLDAAEPDCLRNAVNSFFYENPTNLPPRGPASSLSSEPHSFSRVFTGAFFDALGGMLTIDSNGNAPTEAQLKQASVIMGRLLVQGVLASPITADYYSQVAAHIVEADHNLNNGRYRDALKAAFVRHGVLSLDAADALTSQAMDEAPRVVNLAFAVDGGGGGGGGGGGRAMGIAEGGALDTEEAPKVSINVRGLGNRSIMCYSAGQPKRFGVTAAALGLDALPSQNESRSAVNYTENVIRRGHVDMGGLAKGEQVVVHPFATKTHELVEVDGAVTIIRRFFECGLHQDH